MISVKDTRDNKGTTKCLRIQIPDEEKPSTTKSRRVANVTIDFSKRFLYLNVRVPHDMFLVDYMMRWIEKFNIPLSTFGKNKKTKEISEAGAGIYYATSFELEGSVRCYVIGEGKVPRISLILSKITEWDIVSVDPLIPRTEIRDGVSYISNYDSSLDVSDQTNFNNIVIIGVHSHNRMKAFYDKITTPNKLLVAIPCCVPVNIPNPTYDFHCPGIMSGKNKVLIYSEPYKTIRQLTDPQWEVPDTKLTKIHEKSNKHTNKRAKN